MDIKTKKCVVIIDDELPIGLMVNTAMIMGLTLGKMHPELIGDNVLDQDRKNHLGITEYPIPVLKANKALLKEIREKTYDLDLTVVDFSDIAQSCKDYEDYIIKMKCCSSDQLQYLGLAIYGDKKKLNKLTGNMPLLR